ncbi:MAG: hypothetical protein R3C45_07265 [Phycisphaerales bacterium]
MKQKPGRKGIVLTSLIAAAATGVLITTFLGGGKPPGVTDRAFFYDLNTGELYAADAGLTPPIDAPSGALRGTDNQKAGVRAYVFTCRGGTETDRYIAWIETYAPGARPAPSGGHGPASHPLMQANGSPPPIVARINPDDPADVRWFGSDTPQGLEIIRGNMSACADGSAPVPCVPQ